VAIRVDLSIGEPATLSLRMPDAAAPVSAPDTQSAGAPSQQPQPSAPPATSTAAAEPQQPLRKIKATGSGFVLAANGNILTADHAIDGCGAVSVGGPDQEIRPASVTIADRTNDLAVLNVRALFSAVAQFRLEPPIRQGESVVAVGYPLAGVLAYGTNLTTGIVSALAGIENDSRMLQITSPVQPGNSGGPLLDASGNVIGVVSAKLDAIKVAGITGDIPENVNFALNVSVVRAFLDSHSITYQTANSAAQLSPPDVGDVGTSITELVKCWK
jgi:S1-C subfamily serine protease